jgi:hypothetical protein
MLMVMTTTFFGSRVRGPLLALALLSAPGAQPLAWADGPIYLCVDASGRKELTDTSKAGCKALDLPGAIPAPSTRRASSAARQAGATPSMAPSDFPKVDTAQQRARDNDRREILNDELRSEEAKLAELRREFNGGEPERHGNERNYVKYQERVALMRDNIGRAEKNIEALKREIANIR